MINENEITQPELNMVTEESSAPVAEPQAEPAVEPATEVTETSAEPTTETVSKTSSTIKEEPETGSYPASVETSESEVQKT